ncbi:MAG: hypothetical protein FWC73_05640 [Defluviitaleaceae bacterium]|nr:hypothetical protein [Defluviitaleaceae bacterium]
MSVTASDIQKTRDFYAQKKDAPILLHEFGYYVLDRWIREGHIKDASDLGKYCDFDGHGMQYLWGLGWCEAEFRPAFEEMVLEDRGEYELVQDFAGRHVLYFKGRRNGFMPEYVDHPVKDRDSWERNVKWRLDPATTGREADTAYATRLKELAGQGAMIGQAAVGGYMYLRSLVGPEGALYLFYDDPELIHDIMKAWFELADAVIARHQALIAPFPINELYLAEDNCYNCGPLISPDMLREFFFPYYQQLITNMKARQQGRGFHFQIDTDGDCRPVIPIYQEIGVDYFSPFEVASNCDVVALRKQYPELLMRGGIDKRILAAGKEAIDREIDRIMPFMKAQGGYIPMCDHGVPEEVDFEDFIHYRKRLKEYA